MNRGKGPPARRRKPVVGEDLPAIKNVMKEIKDQPITLDEFLTLISPHTGDKGAALIKVMTEDVTAFRRMVIKVYDTMSQDVSDVLANEQMELAKVYSERQRLLMDKMLRCLQQISDIIENFDFKRYYADPEGYLALLFQIADVPDDEEVEAARRQLAYHRLQWLQSEGERLQSENVKLQERLKQLKKIQRAEITESIRVEKEAEIKKVALERQQAQMQNKLEELTEVLQETIVAEEKQTIDKKKQVQKKAYAQKKPFPTESVYSKADSSVSWNVKTAAEIESIHVVGSTMSQSTTASRKSQSSTNRAAMKSQGSLLKRPSTQPSATSSLISKVSSTAKQPPPKSAFGGSVMPTTSRLKPPSTSRLRPPSKSCKPPASSALQVPKPAAPAKKAACPKKKKPAPVKNRPEWRDVDLGEFEVPMEAEQVPMDIFRRPASAQPCPPTCGTSGGPPRQASPPPRQPSPPPRQPSPPPRQPSPRPRQPSPPPRPTSSPPRPASPPGQAGSSRLAPPSRQASPPCPPTCGARPPPSNRRGSAPRDSWGGFY